MAKIESNEEFHHNKTVKNRKMHILLHTFFSIFVNSLSFSFFFPCFLQRMELTGK